MQPCDIYDLNQHYVDSLKIESDPNDFLNIKGHFIGQRAKYNTIRFDVSQREDKKGFDVEFKIVSRASRQSITEKYYLPFSKGRSLTLRRKSDQESAAYSIRNWLTDTTTDNTLRPAAQMSLKSYVAERKAASQFLQNPKEPVYYYDKPNDFLIGIFRIDELSWDAQQVIGAMITVFNSDSPRTMSKVQVKKVLTPKKDQPPRPKNSHTTNGIFDDAHPVDALQVRTSVSDGSVHTFHALRQDNSGFIKAGSPLINYLKEVILSERELANNVLPDLRGYNEKKLFNGSHDPKGFWLKGSEGEAIRVLNSLAICAACPTFLMEPNRDLALGMYQLSLQAQNANNGASNPTISFPIWSPSWTTDILEIIRTQFHFIHGYEEVCHTKDISQELFCEPDDVEYTNTSKMVPSVISVDIGTLIGTSPIDQINAGRFLFNWLAKIDDVAGFNHEILEFLKTAYISKQYDPLRSDIGALIKNAKQNGAMHDH